jgi:hypothetical protein
MKTKLILIFALFFFVIRLSAQVYRPPDLAYISVLTQSGSKAVQINYRAGTYAAPFVILHYSGITGFSKSAFSTSGSPSVLIPIPLNSAEHYELEAVEFSDAGGNTRFVRDGTITRLFYSDPTLIKIHSATLSSADFGAGLQVSRDTGRAINLSSLTPIAPGGIFTVGFVVGTGARSFLIRAVGPELSGFGVSDVMADPMLTVFNGAGERITGNDDWTTPTPATVGAFPLAAGSKSANLLLRLMPGSYSAQVRNVVPNQGGTVLVEIYEIPN